VPAIMVTPALSITPFVPSFPSQLFPSCMCEVKTRPPRFSGVYVPNQRCTPARTWLLREENKWAVTVGGTSVAFSVG
jgi:hypothetical protein